MTDNPISASFDFEVDGIHHGFLNLPYSRNDSAWGSVMIPISMVKNGSGPTALLTGANHGDEYEGVIALMDLSARLEQLPIRGRVIIIPAMNYPAFRAGTRVSPIDNLNMNRIFPGQVPGTVSQVIAHYFNHTLLPLADYVLDIHSGGKTLDFVPFAAVHHLANKKQEAQCVAAMQAMQAPYHLKLVEIDSIGMYDTAAEEQGKVFVSTELGGGGTTRPESNQIAKRCVHNFLVHASILKEAPQAASRPTTALSMPDERSYVQSLHSGLVENCAEIGETVEEGQLLAKIYDPERIGQTAIEYYAPRAGLVMSRHYPALIQLGDCLAVIARIDG